MSKHAARHVIARQIHLGHEDLEIDGVRLPWLISPEVDVEMEDAPYIYGLTVTFYADRIIVQNKDAAYDTSIQWAREEAIRIVHEGLADVRRWLGE